MQIIQKFVKKKKKVFSFISMQSANNALIKGCTEYPQVVPPHSKTISSSRAESDTPKTCFYQIKQGTIATKHKN